MDHKRQCFNDNCTNDAETFSIYCKQCIDKCHENGFRKLLNKKKKQAECEHRYVGDYCPDCGARLRGEK